MTITHKSFSFFYSSILKKTGYVVSILLLTCMLVFCVFYLSHDYQQLKTWYLSLNDCFYNADIWATHFFTSTTKQKGNTLAIVGSILSVLLIIYLIFSWQRYNKWGGKEDSFIQLNGAGWYFAVAGITLVSGIISWRLTAPAYDEVFSAVNCAELHPLQTISYYMLPNNHLYFNFLNNVLFSWYHDPVSTGRFLSLVAYIGVALCAFHWLQQLMGNRFFALLAVIPVALQFITWGLGAQARGYELQLLCAWGAFLTIIYYLQTPNNRLLRLNALFCIVGFSLVSTFLFYYVAQTIVVVSSMAYRRQIKPTFLKYQAVIIAMVFLLYLPAFCFSGVSAFTANRYVTPLAPTWQAFVPDFFNIVKYFINCCFSMLCGEDRTINFILFFLPLSLFFFKNKRDRSIAFFYTVLWLTYIFISLYMRRYSFTRNMAIHYSITMAIVVYTLFRIVEATATLVSEKRRPIIETAFFLLPMLAYGVFLGITDKRDAPFLIYYNNVNSIYDGLVKGLEFIPTDASVSFSQESFYPYYLLRNNHPNAHRCSSGNETYYIKRNYEPLPLGRENDYIKVKDGPEDYEFYKKK